jgi:putative heme-binding domain-containing protein
MIEPRYELRILSAGVSGDGRSVSVQTAPRAMALNYGVTLREPGGDARIDLAAAGGFILRNDKGAVALPQHASIDLACGLTGVEAIWRDTNGKEQWSGWLPHLDLAVARAFTAASEEHGRLFELLKKPGVLQLRTQLDLWQMLRAATQAGSKLDFEYPPEMVTVTFKASGALKLHTSPAAKVDHVTDYEARIIAESKKDEWVPVELTLATGAGEPGVGLTWHTAEDARLRALHLRRLLLPWATPPLDSSLFAERKIPEITGGNWSDGKKIFFSDQAACYKCHQVGGEGGKLGPDLSNLIHRDYASVLKDITQPSAAINPDHLAYIIELNDGELVNGVILSDNQAEAMVGLASGVTMNIPKARIKNVKTSALSLMPENLLQGLDAQQRKNLFTFLLMGRPE